MYLPVNGAKKNLRFRCHLIGAYKDSNHSYCIALVNDDGVQTLASRGTYKDEISEAWNGRKLSSKPAGAGYAVDVNFKNGEICTVTAVIRHTAVYPVKITIFQKEVWGSEA